MKGDIENMIIKVFQGLANLNEAASLGSLTS